MVSHHEQQKCIQSEQGKHTMECFVRVNVPFRPTLR